MPTASAATRRLVTLTAIITAAILIIGVGTLWQTIESSASSDAIRATTNEVRESSLISACRSELRVAIDLTDARVDDITLSGLIAVAQEDPDQLVALVADAQDALEDARSAVDAYAQGVTLSHTDPDRFIAECQAR